MFTPPIAEPTILKPYDSGAAILLARETPPLWLVYDAVTKTILIRGGESQLQGRSIAALSLSADVPYSSFHALLQMSRAERVHTLGVRPESESFVVHTLLTDSLYLLDCGFVDGIDERIVLAKNLVRFLEATEQRDAYRLVHAGLLHRLFLYSHLRFRDLGKPDTEQSARVRSDLNLAALWWFQTCLKGSDAYYQAVGTSRYSLIYDLAFDCRSDGYEVRAFLRLGENRTLLRALEKWLLVEAYDLKNATVLRRVREGTGNRRSMRRTRFSDCDSVEEAIDRLQRPPITSLVVSLVVVIPTLLIILSRVPIVPSFTAIGDSSRLFGLPRVNTSWLVPSNIVQLAVDVVWQIQLILMLSVLGLSLVGISGSQKLPAIVHSHLNTVHLPRMSAAIILGYLTLFLDNGPWHLGQSLPLWSLAVLVFLALLVSLLYLHQEIRKKLGGTRGVLALRRALDIIARAFVTSWTVGMTLNVLVGPYVSDSSVARAIELCLPFQLTVTWPNLFLFAVLSLLVGIMVQLLWEEKGITEPL